MPICPRCGKCLTSDQALTYHMNKKFKCGSWCCVKCDVTFTTKLDLQMHNIKCQTEHVTKGDTQQTIMNQVYSNGNIAILEIDSNRIVISASPSSSNVLGIPAVKGLSIDQLSGQNTRTMQKLNDNIILFY